MPQAVPILIGCRIIVRGVNIARKRKMVTGLARSGICIGTSLAVMKINFGQILALA